MTLTDDTILAPVVGQTTWAFDADDINATTYIAVPDAWKECVLEFHADGEAFAFGFGDATLTGVTPGNASTIASNAISAQGANPYVLASGSRVRVDLRLVHPSQKARLGLLGITGNAANALRVTRISGRVK